MQPMSGTIMVYGTGFTHLQHLKESAAPCKVVFESYQSYPKLVSSLSHLSPVYGRYIMKYLHFIGFTNQETSSTLWIIHL